MISTETVNTEPVQYNLKAWLCGSLSRPPSRRHDFGLDFEKRDDGHYYVTRVESLAKQCGDVEVGDRLLKFQGQPASDYQSVEELTEVLKGALSISFEALHPNLIEETITEVPNDVDLGDVVPLGGMELDHKSYLNGKDVQVLRQVTSSDQWLVKVLDGEKKGEKILVKTENLRYDLLPDRAFYDQELPNRIMAEHQKRQHEALKTVKKNEETENRIYKEILKEYKKIKITMKKQLEKEGLSKTAPEYKKNFKKKKALIKQLEEYEEWNDYLMKHSRSKQGGTKEAKTDDVATNLKAKVDKAAQKAAEKVVAERTNSTKPTPPDREETNTQELTAGEERLAQRQVLEAELRKADREQEEMASKEVARLVAKRLEEQDGEIKRVLQGIESSKVEEHNARQINVQRDKVLNETRGKQRWQNELTDSSAGLEAVLKVASKCDETTHLQEDVVVSENAIKLWEKAEISDYEDVGDAEAAQKVAEVSKDTKEIDVADIQEDKEEEQKEENQAKQCQKEEEEDLEEEQEEERQRQLKEQQLKRQQEREDQLEEERRRPKESELQKEQERKRHAKLQRKKEEEEELKPIEENASADQSEQKIQEELQRQNDFERKQQRQLEIRCQKRKELMKQKKEAQEQERETQCQREEEELRIQKELEEQWHREAEKERQRQGELRRHQKAEEIQDSIDEESVTKYEVKADSSLNPEEAVEEVKTDNLDILQMEEEIKQKIAEEEAKRKSNSGWGIKNIFGKMKAATKSESSNNNEQAGSADEMASLPKIEYPISPICQAKIAAVEEARRFAEEEAMEAKRKAQQELDPEKMEEALARFNAYEEATRQAAEEKERLISKAEKQARKESEKAVMLEKLEMIRGSGSDYDDSDDDCEDHDSSSSSSSSSGSSSSVSSEGSGASGSSSDVSLTGSELKFVTNSLDSKETI